jgi:hypothetical protein
VVSEIGIIFHELPSNNRIKYGKLGGGRRDEGGGRMEEEWERN